MARPSTSAVSLLSSWLFLISSGFLLIAAAPIGNSVLDQSGSHYSPLAQINTQNVSRLRRAWTYHTGEKGRQFETEPILIDGVLYLTSQNSRVVALEPETGKEIWTYDPHASRPRENRGVSYWPGDGQRGGRIFLGTGDGQLIALDPKTGKPETEFGDNGVVNLRTGVAEDYPKASYAITSRPAIYQNLVIVGPSTQEGPTLGPSADPRAFDARTGKLVWRFHTVPRPGEPGNETWGPNGWNHRGGPSLWGQTTIDNENGLVFLPIGNPADSFYGADRKGMNLYANCVVALEAATGKLRWYYQMVHHDIFDFDVSAAPALITVTREGKQVPAVAEITKMGLLFILDRLTGQPIFGAEERRVPPSDVPGEEAWPTQPFPLKPPPLARVNIDREDLAKRTPESQKYCTEIFDKHLPGTLYTPFGLKPTLMFPGSMGGGNWGGVSFDPKSALIFVNTSNMGVVGHMARTPAGSPMPYKNETAYQRFLDQDGYPCQQPPWGVLSAVNANTGDIVWQSTLGGFTELAPQHYDNAGSPNVGGSIATAGGLVFIAATNDFQFRAFDAHTGRLLWVTRLDATGNATPMTYEGRDGKQYVVIAAGGPFHLRNVGNNAKNSADTLIAFALSSVAVTEQNVTPEAAAETVTPPVTKPATAITGNLPEAAGKSAVVEVCSKCHGVETFSRSRMSREEWSAVVNDMVQRGAKGTPDQIQTVIDYLGQYLGRE